MKEKGQIIKYTIVPRNDKDDYDSNFRLSLTEFAKSLDGKVLLAPFKRPLQLKPLNELVILPKKPPRDGKKLALITGPKLLPIVGI